MAPAPRKMVSAAVLMFLAAVGTAIGRQGAAQAQALRPFEETGFGTQSLVPNNWRRVKDSRWEGSRFISPDGQSSLVVYALPRTRESIEEHIRWFTRLNGEKITYLKRGRTWVVVSGYKGDRIYYRKARLGCDGTWHHIALEYPAESKRAYDGIVTAISHSLQPGDPDTGCA